MDQYEQYGQQQPYRNVVVKEADMTVKDWLITFLLLVIPIANIVFAIIWAIGGDNIPLSKRNYFRAYWIVAAIVTVIYILMLVVFMVIGVGIFSTISEMGFIM